MRLPINAEVRWSSHDRSFPVRALALLVIGMSFVAEHSDFMRAVGALFLLWLVIDIVLAIRSSRHPTRR